MLKSTLPSTGCAANLAGMSKIINLRTHKKQAARDAKRRQGDAKAARHGRSLAERKAEQAKAETARNHLDRHKRDP